MQFLFMILFGIVVCFVLFISYKAYVFDKNQKNVNSKNELFENKGEINKDIQSNEVIKEEKFKASRETVYSEEEIIWEMYDFFFLFGII